MKMQSTLEGTYRLAKWEALDPEQNVPPFQPGTLTFTATHRIFTFVGKDERGELSSEMYVARYALTEHSYSETPEYLVLDHHHGAQPATFDLEHETVASPVTREGAQLSFELPHPFERAYPVTVTFGPTRMEAVIGGQFVYTWEKIA